MSYFKLVRGRSFSLGLLCLALLIPLAAVSGQETAPAVPFNERSIEPELTVFDKEDIWTLHFRFKDPRIITADVPGRGKKIIWYMWYQVINRTGEQRTFIPEFELVTLDGNTVHMDEVLPSVQEVIRRIEDPTGRLDIKNSVTISKEPIPPSMPNAAPRPVTGVAIWTDVYDKAADTTRFSIFVSGLSNGWTEDDNKVIRRKTLQLNFKRLTDRKNLDSSAIRFVDNPSWIYRASAADLKGDAAPAPAPAVKPAPIPEPARE